MNYPPPPKITSQNVLKCCALIRLQGLYCRKANRWLCWNRKYWKQKASEYFDKLHGMQECMSLEEHQELRAYCNHWWGVNYAISHPSTESWFDFLWRW